MKKEITLALMSMIMALISLNANADAKALKIGFVNFDEAAAKEDEARKFVENLKAEEKKLEDSRSKARQEIEAEVAKFQSTMGKLDEKAKQAQQTTLGNKINKLEQDFAKQGAELEQNRMAKQGELQRKNQLLVDSIRSEQGYDVILDARMIVSMSDSFKKNDVTSELVTRYNKAYRPAPTVPAKKSEATKTEPKVADPKKKTSDDTSSNKK